MSAASERPPRPLDARRLLETLNRHGVEYVVIGGVAMQALGHVRTTQDLDVIARWSRGNLENLGRALRELGAALRGVDAHQLGIDPGEPEHLYRGGNFLLETPHGDLDVFSVEDTRGAPKTYEDLRRRALAIQLESGTRALVADPEHMMRMKAAAASFRDRPEDKRRQDFQDQAVLSRLLRERDGP